MKTILFYLSLITLAFTTITCKNKTTEDESVNKIITDSTDYNALNTLSDKEDSDLTEDQPEKVNSKKSLNSKKTEPKAAAKRIEPKREEPKREEPKREEPKREEPKREEPKREEPKREEPKREEPKREEPLKETKKEVTPLASKGEIKSEQSQEKLLKKVAKSSPVNTTEEVNDSKPKAVNKYKPTPITKERKEKIASQQSKPKRKTSSNLPEIIGVNDPLNSTKDIEVVYKGYEEAQFTHLIFTDANMHVYDFGFIDNNITGIVKLLVKEKKSKFGFNENPEMVNRNFKITAKVSKITHKNNENKTVVTNQWVIASIAIKD